MMKLSKDEVARYGRHLQLPQIGMKGQEKLKAARIAVVGAGGLGCPALLYLTAAGVGTIAIIDSDRVETSNLQRQVLYKPEDKGKHKAGVAAALLSGQNPFTEFEVYNVRLGNAGALRILRDYDIVIDATDNFASRYLINDACVLLDKPLVYGSVYKFEGQVSVFNYTDASGVKGPCYRSLYPVPPVSAPDCSAAGVLGVLPGLIGTMQANEAIKIITGIGVPLSGRLLLVNALTMEFTTLQLANLPVSGGRPATEREFSKTDYELLCENHLA